MSRQDPWAFQRWAYRSKTGSIARKAVLMVLAAMAEKNTGRCEGSQQSIADWVETDDRTVRRHLEALTSDGLIARRHQYRRDGKRGCDEFLLLAPWVTEWPDGEPLPGRLSGSDEGDYRADSTPTTGHQCPDIEKNKPLNEQAASARITANAVMLAARAPTNDADPLDDLPEPERTVGTIAARVARAKSCPRPAPATVVRLCKRYADRELALDAEEFAHYWLSGRGENGQVRDVARALSNWLRRSPSAEGRRRAPRGARDARLAESRAAAAAAYRRIQEQAA